MLTLLVCFVYVEGVPRSVNLVWHLSCGSLSILLDDRLPIHNKQVPIFLLFDYRLILGKKSLYLPQIILDFIVVAILITNHHSLV